MQMQGLTILRTPGKCPFPDPIIWQSGFRQAQEAKVFVTLMQQGSPDFGELYDNRCFCHGAGRGAISRPPAVHVLPLFTLVILLVWARSLKL